jgi:DNA-binding MarR family transcriptional regulator
MSVHGIATARSRTTEKTRRAPRQATGADVLEFLRLFWAIGHQLQRASKRLRRDLGVTGPQRLAIRVLVQSPGASPQSVAAALHLHKSTVTGILQRLEKQRLVTRLADVSDRRRVRLRLTRKGLRVNAYAGPSIERAIHAALARMSRHARKSLATALATVAEELHLGS